MPLLVSKRVLRFDPDATVSGIPANGAVPVRLKRTRVTCVTVCVLCTVRYCVSVCPTVPCVSYRVRVQYLLSPLLVLLVRVRESGFCWKIWIRFFYGCGGCAVYFVFSTFLLFQIL